jgi:hypothetical protein
MYLPYLHHLHKLIFDLPGLRVTSYLGPMSGDDYAAPRRVLLGPVDPSLQRAVPDLDERPASTSVVDIRRDLLACLSSVWMLALYLPSFLVTSY